MLEMTGSPGSGSPDSEKIKAMTWLKMLIRLSVPENSQVLSVGVAKNYCCIDCWMGQYLLDKQKQ